jgi:transposase InsO family protein
MHRFNTIEEARAIIAAFIECYNQQWLIERLGHRTPATTRQEMLAMAA